MRLTPQASLPAQSPLELVDRPARRARGDRPAAPKKPSIPARAIAITSGVGGDAVRHLPGDVGEADAVHLANERSPSHSGIERRQGGQQRVVRGPLPPARAARTSPPNATPSRARAALAHDVDGLTQAGDGGGQPFGREQGRAARALPGADGGQLRAASRGFGGHGGHIFAQPRRGHGATRRGTACGPWRTLSYDSRLIAHHGGPMLERWLTQLEKVHRATTREAREGIYRFRYRVYIEELKYPYPADHERRWLREDEDEQDYTTLFYTGTPEQVTSAVRVRVWKPGMVPPKAFESMSLELFPGIERLTIAHVGRLMISRGIRGKLLLPSLLGGGYDYVVGEMGVDLLFLDCVPGIVRYYRQLGAVPYGGRLVDLGYSPGIPLVIVPSDYEHLKRSGSIVAPLVKKHFGPGKRPPLDKTPFLHLLEGETAPVEFDPSRVWSEIQERLLEGEGPATSFLDSLPERAVKQLSKSGFLLDVEAGSLVTRQGTGEREMYVVLAGAFDVLVDGRRVALLEPGELFGELAFFTTSGERTASVRALTAGRVLVLRRKFLLELSESDPRGRHAAPDERQPHHGRAHGRPEAVRRRRGGRRRGRRTEGRSVKVIGPSPPCGGSPTPALRRHWVLVLERVGAWVRAAP